MVRNSDGSLSLDEYEVAAWRLGPEWEWVPASTATDDGSIILPPMQPYRIVRVGPDPLAKYRFGARS